MLDRRFTCVRLSHPYMTWSIHAFDHNVHHRGHCAAAACGSLKPLPAERPRGTFPWDYVKVARDSGRTSRVPIVVACSGRGSTWERGLYSRKARPWRTLAFSRGASMFETSSTTLLQLSPR